VFVTSPSPKLRLVRPERQPDEEAKASGPPPPPAEPERLRAAESLAYHEPTSAALYEQYASYVATVASRILGRAAEVDDAVQEVFASAVRGLRRREDPREIRAWLAKVTVRRCLRQLRFRRIWALVDLTPDPGYERLADPGAGPEERQLIIEVYRALDRLPARERVAWTLRNVEGEALEDIASMCGCSLATAKRRIASAHEKLCKYLRGRGP
jgi:RNA polymerase sigma-70 factor (ECF subfamily)